MLRRYTIYRGKRPPGDPLPDGERQDTRKHTRHCLRPTAAIVETFLADASDEAWVRLRDAYLEVVEARFAEDPAPFEQLATLARTRNVYLGCNCPTRKNPDVNHCHTVLALRFMREKFPDLDVVMP
ncbi:MAG: hypothetical protein ACYS0D_06290 [Planctomycetota bacterium]|jgi:hypothetical protein